MAQRKTTTAADIAAAIALGAMPEDAEVITAEAAAKMAAEAAKTARAEAAATSTVTTTLEAPAATAEHHCTQRGCRHGTHSGTPQPDRQLKMTAPCGAVLRITGRALARAGAAITCGHGDAFVVDTTRRAYGRKTTTADGTAPAA